MGFSSGASSAKRKAKKAAAQQYYKEFKKLKAIPDVGRISTKNKRSVEESIGDGASFRTRNLSKKADRLAGKINRDDDYKSKVNAYNDRYAILKGQMANKSSSRYTINDKPAVLPSPRSNDYFGSSQNTIKNGAGDYPSVIPTALPTAPVSSSFATKGTMFTTKDEAMSDATKRMEAYNESLSGLLGSVKPAQSSNGMYGSSAIGGANKYSQKDLDAMRVSDPSRFIQEEKFNGFGVLYRNLEVAESAANDLTALGKNVTNSTGNKNISQYSALAEKLKPLVKRDANNAQPATSGQSIVANELASANPYTETIS